MKVTRLVLQNFRSYSQLQLELHAATTALIGDNAMGKTNILEAIYCCCVGRSHRAGHDAELVRKPCEQGLVQVDYQNALGAGQIELQLFAHGRKRVLLDQLPARRIADLYGRLNCVLFSPEDLSLVKDGPGVRRSYVDIALSQVQPAYFVQLQQYMRVLAQRNALLRQDVGPGDTLWAWDEQLATAAVGVYTRRAAFLNTLSGLAQQTYSQMADETFTMTYAPNIPADSPQAILRALADSRSTDLARGITTVGPHRDEIELSISGRPARQYASQGQQRTIALALRIAELQVMQQQTGQWPLLLLDDVLSELDRHRRKALLSLLPQVQTLVTGTDRAGLETLPHCNIYQVGNGQVCPWPSAE